MSETDIAVQENAHMCSVKCDVSQMSQVWLQREEAVKEKVSW